MFKRNEVFALEADADPRVIRVTRRGHARGFADLPAETFPSGIAFDRVGGFGGRLLVTGRVASTVDLYGIDCRGRVRTFVDDAPQVEGGMQVAPRSFHPYGGRLIAADEFGGDVIAFGANGSSRAIAASGLPAGPDLGVESVGFVPKRFGRGDAAYLADFGVPGAAFPGTDAVLAATANELRHAGVRSGDLLVATEGGAETIRVRCGEGGACGVTQVGTGPDVTHAEGHIEFGPAP